MATRIAGVGVAIFVFFFFLVFCLLCCLWARYTKCAWFWYSWSTFIFVMVVLVLFASPKGPQDEPPEGYDTTYIGLAVIMTLICFGIFWAFLGMLIWLVFPQRYARPLRYDVALNREGTEFQRK